MGSEPTLSGSICRLGLIPADLLGTLPAETRTIAAASLLRLAASLAHPQLAQD
ncbi:MAG: hypothetical protein OES10_05200 [Gammaproteobacteria bacterium]|jgi:hypothetical protein|nr:hypothetical protein [Gammaproteobacteria bacterium]MDH3749353.1 hypothetical protein [Gammaproteobacteria bacterium]